MHHGAVHQLPISADDRRTVAYQLSFFCRSGEENGDEALDRLLDYLLESGDGLVGEWLGPFEDRWPRSGSVLAVGTATGWSRTC